MERLLPFLLIVRQAKCSYYTIFNAVTCNAVRVPRAYINHGLSILISASVVRTSSRRHWRDGLSKEYWTFETVKMAPRLRPRRVLKRFARLVCPAVAVTRLCVRLGTFLKRNRDYAIGTGVICYVIKFAYVRIVFELSSGHTRSRPRDSPTRPRVSVNTCRRPRRQYDTLRTRSRPWAVRAF